MRTRFTLLALALLLGVSACGADTGTAGASPDDSAFCYKHYKKEDC